MERRFKPYEELTFSDDFMFSKIMRDPEIARGVVENLLGVKVSRIEFLTSQHTIDAAYSGKGVRLDAYLEDESRIFDIEIQTVVKADEGLRMRYYQGIIDTEKTPRGRMYRTLKETYIMFICLSDPLGRGKAVYHFVTKDLDDNHILNDRTHKIFYNASAFEKAGDPKVRAFLKFLNRRAASDPLTQKIQAEVALSKKAEKWRTDYMLWEDQIEEWKLEGREEGIAQGEKQGALNKAVETAKKLLKNNIPEKIIAECTGLSLEQIKSL